MNKRKNFQKRLYFCIFHCPLVDPPILIEPLLNEPIKREVKKYYPHVNQSIRVANSVLSIGNSSQRKHRRTSAKSQIILNLKYGLNGCIKYIESPLFRDGRTDPRKNQMTEKIIFENKIDRLK